MPYLFILTVLINSYGQVGEIKAKTDSGKDVILRPDGTWFFAGSHNKIKDSVVAYNSRRGVFSVSLPQGRWKKLEKANNQAAEVEFVDTDGDIHCMIISERIQVPLKALQQSALDNAKSVDGNAKIIFEEKRMVNGREALCMSIDVDAMGVPMVFHSYYYSSQNGSFQIITYTGKNLFKELKPQMEEFLNGFEITKKDD